MMINNLLIAYVAVRVELVIFQEADVAVLGDS